jgi:hypothetical protein
MGVNSIIFSFLISIAFSFGDCKNLFELKANKTLTNDSIQLSSSYLGYCDWNSDCLGFDTKCVDNKCRCAPDYKYDYLSQSCQYCLCTSDSDCQTYDYNRYCSFHHCYCYSGYYTDYSNGQKCTYSYDYTWVWILVGIIIPLKIAILIFYIRRRRRRFLTVVRTNPQPVTIITNTGYGSNPYQTSQGINNYPTNSLMQSVPPPPPPYSSK